MSTTTILFLIWYLSGSVFSIILCYKAGIRVTAFDWIIMLSIGGIAGPCWFLINLRFYKQVKKLRKEFAEMQEFDKRYVSLLRDGSISLNEYEQIRKSL